VKTDFYQSKGWKVVVLLGSEVHVIDFCG